MKFFLGAIVAGIATFARAQEPRPPESIRLELDPHTPLRKIAEDFIGFGYETSAVAREGFFSAKNTHMVQLYRTLSTNGLVRIGGIIGDHTRFEPGGLPVAHAMQETTVINRAVLADFAGFLRATGWKALWTLNLGTGSKEEAVQEALAVQAALGDRLQSFEIGNEVDLLRRFDGFASYHAAYLDYKAAIRAALPDAVFSGPDSAGNAKWSVEFAQSEAKDMKLLLHHYYRGGANSAQATIARLLGPHPEWESTLEQLRETCDANGLAYRINEVNSFSGGGKPEVSDTFASALWCLDFMFRVAAHGGAGVNMETDVNQLGFVSYYSPIYRGENNALTARPEYYGMLAFSLAGTGSLVKITTSDHALNLGVYAAKRSEETVWVTIVNKDLAQAAKIELTLLAGFSKVEAFRLIAPSIQSKADVTLAGASVASDETWSPGSPENISVDGQAASLPVGAGSAVLLRLQ